jgi:hypothetical protein
MAEDGRIRPGPTPDAIKALLARGIRGFGTETVGTDAGQGMHYDPPYPAHYFLHGAGQIRPAVPLQSRPAAPDRRDADRAAAEDQGRHRQPAAGAGARVPETGDMTEYTAVITGAAKGIGADLAARCSSAATG